MNTWSAHDLGETGGGARITIAPKDYVPSGNTKRGVILCHWYGGAAVNYIDPTLNIGTIGNAIAQVYPCVACDLGGQQWGNATAVARMNDAFSLLTSTFGAKLDKVLLVGASMGNLSAMNWALANLAKVAAIVGLIPVSNLQDMVTNNRGGYAANVNAVYSGGYSDATYGANYNPTVYGASLSGVPVRLYYASDDTTVIPSTVTTLASTIGASASTVNLGNAGGHTDATLAAVSQSDLLAFLAAHA